MTETATPPAPSFAEIEAAAADPATRNRAIDMAIAAMGAGTETPLVVQLVSEGLEEDGRIWDAAAFAEKVTTLAPESAAAWIRLGRLLHRLNQLAEAREAVRRATELEPDSYDAHMLAAAVEFSFSRFEAAIAHAEAAGGLRPEAAEPLETLAVIRARLRDLAGARTLAERALAIAPSLGGAATIVARVELAENRPMAAAARLQALLSRSDLARRHRAEPLGLLGDAREALGESARAFAAFCASNAAMGDEAKAQGVAGGVAEHARLMERFFTNADPALWREPAGADRARPSGLAGHVLVVGFPRSGTTLLENALAGHPEIVALEEPDALGRANANLFNDEGALARLADLALEEADACRQVYWDRIAELTPEPLEGKVLVDKMPINILALPVIAKLFGEAKVLLARRDPRDVVFGCFRRNFGVNALLVEFQTLEGAARCYDAIMRLAATYEEKLPIRPHVIRNEDVIADFDRELGAALAFIGLGFDPAVREFAGRGLLARTPSATQLASGLSDRGVGGWRPYARYMAPVLPLLEPWVERFGYAPTEPTLLPPGPDPAFAPTRASIGRALGIGAWREVFARVDQAFAAGFDDPFLHRLRGVRLQQEGRPAEAAADFDIAIAEEPGNVGLINALGLCLARSGRSVEALDRLDEAIALDPTFAPAHFNRGWTLEARGELALAHAAYARAIAHDPKHAAALGALAALASRAGVWDEARTLGEQALAIAPATASAELAIAQADTAQGAAGRAEERLRKCIAGGRAGAHETAFAQRLLGDALDAQDRPGEAFAAYAAGAAGMKAVHAPRFAASGAERAGAIIGRLQAFFDVAPTEAHRESGSGEGDAPVFVLGFPRSGTTLVGQALGLHPSLFTLDEVDTLGDATRAFFADEAGLKELVSLTDARASEFRARYFARARAAGWPEGGRRLVDKAPMNTLALPIIAKLFPAAKILFMRRDPRDVVFSCFRRQFGVNPTTIDFLTLEGAARLYDATMSLFETYRKKLPLDVRVQIHEGLASDFEAEARAICDFLGLEWSERMGEFADRARAVATPSAAQLAGGLSAEGVGAWRRYREQLAPILPILQPWVERFGYPAD
ncbi:MAG TPA: sulfotransferase [Caulobacteraceae bacterium]|nr:sulfotransferase [Caulobacteraceae bacterium]